MGVILPYKGIWPRIGSGVFIAPTAVVIGDVEIGEESSLWFGSVVRGDVHEIRIGKRTNIQDGTVIHVTEGNQGTYIGDDITVGHMALIHACTLETGCFIGMKACVMDNARVEEGAMVGAGALVTPGKKVSAGHIWAGSPARYWREITATERRMFDEKSAHYVELAKTYLSSLGSDHSS